MFDGFDPADLLGVRDFARPGLVLDPRDPINRLRTGTWPLDGPGNATALDISGYRRHAVPVNAPTSVTGRFGPARSFSTTSYLLAQEADGAPLITSYTYAVWMRGTTAPGLYSGVFAKTKGASDGQVSLSDNNPNFGIYHDNITPAWDTGLSIPGTFDGNWHLVVIGYSAGTCYCWRDGVLIQSSAFGVAPDSGAGSLKIASERGGTSGYSWKNPLALLSEFRRLLTTAEVQRLYREPFAGIISEDDRFYHAFKAPAGGTVWNETLSESLAAAESFAGTLTAPVTLADALTGADAATVALTGAVALADALTGADSHAATLAAVAVLAESATAGEVLSPAMTAGVALSDAGALADSLSPAATFGLALSDSLTAADALTISAVMAAALAESVAGAESFAAVLLASTSLTDAATLADAYALAIPGTPAPASRTVTWRAHDRLATWAAETRTVTWRAHDRTAKWQE